MPNKNKLRLRYSEEFHHVLKEMREAAVEETAQEIFDGLEKLSVSTFDQGFILKKGSKYLLINDHVKSTKEYKKFKLAFLPNLKVGVSSEVS